MLIDRHMICECIIYMAASRKMMEDLCLILKYERRDASLHICIDLWIACRDL